MLTHPLLLIATASALLAACQTTAPGPAPDSAAQAQNQPPTIVASVCADCHAVKAPFLSPNEEAPPFDALANQPGLTSETITRWLVDAHNYPELMEFALSEEEAKDVAGYILTLKSDDYRPSE